MDHPFCCSCVGGSALFELHNLSERRKRQKTISVAASLGVETVAHTDFVNKSLRNTNLDGKARVRVFLGPYKDIPGSDGRLESLPPDYYIFLDMHFYRSLEPDEKEALVAHELGHAVYESNSGEQLKLNLEYKMRRQGLFREWLDQISTKYQKKADEFSASRTSVRSMFSLLKKLYRGDDKPLDYRSRAENLRRIEQGQ